MTPTQQAPSGLNLCYGDLVRTRDGQKIGTVEDFVTLESGAVVYRVKFEGAGGAFPFFAEQLVKIAERRAR